MLIEAGYPLPLAEKIAHSEADLHRAVELVLRRLHARDRGRDPALAAPPGARGHAGPNHAHAAERACLLSRLACFRAGGKQLPVPLGDDFDGAVDHLDGGLIVNRVRRH